jgi:hypothetical protein
LNNHFASQPYVPGSEQLSHPLPTYRHNREYYTEKRFGDAQQPCSIALGSI